MQLWRRVMQVKISYNVDIDEVPDLPDDIQDTMISRRGQGISINTVIIIALAVMALVLVAFFFIGGFGAGGSAVTSTTEEAAAGLGALFG